MIGHDLVLAGLTGAGLTYLALRQRVCPEPEAHALTDADREAVAAEFAQHVTAVNRQVSDYADQLAGSDTTLRGLLAVIEQSRADRGNKSTDSNAVSDSDSDQGGGR
ncbi:hypothetical protein [Nocardioides humi]|uniref:Uncharacterized protein n=1 Tax=Nocardioides humi TaxID=449461 RepID=A0ABN2A0C4_9ACTN|nr:hypothetical protein [Nocardioides humi]